MKPDVICAGIVVADLFCDPIDHFPVAGSLQLIEDMLPSAGGCAANTAVCLAKLGLRASVSGTVGKDIFGDFILDYLQARNVDVCGIIRSSERGTSKTVIVNVRGEDRRYFHCVGANADFAAADVLPLLQKGAAALYVGGYLALPRLTQEGLTGLLRRAKELGIMNALDVVIPNVEPCGIEVCDKALAWTDVFLPNNDEARCLTGLDEPVEQARALAAISNRIVAVVTCGSAGAVACTAGAVQAIGSYPVTVTDPSGAGDAFAAGFIAGSIERWPLDKTLQFAAALGASAVRAKACTPGVFTRQEALEYIATHPLQPFAQGEY